MPSKKANQLMLKGLFSALASLCFFSTHLSVQAADNEGADERWFEIEVILYKATSDQGLTNESWDTEAPFHLPENLKDFLNPKATAEPFDAPKEPLTDTQKQQRQIDSIKENQTTFTEANNTSSDTHSNRSNADPELKKQAFIPLEDAFLQLKKEAKNISVHPRFKLLAHFAWRQPVAGKSTATPVRLAGGSDYHETFDFNGTKKLELENNLTDSLETISSSGTNSEKLSLEKHDNNSDTDSLNVQNDNSSEAIDAEPKLLPWVPEIDGSAIVYIYRNYLHVDANLVFRKPGQLEIDIFSLNPGNDFEDQPLMVPAPSLANELQSFKGEKKQQELTKIKDNSDHEESFAWHFDSDFLNQDTEKVYTEKLFNYPLKQTRRMRSTELHYFDHPKIGMLVVIRPYQVNTNIEN